MEPTAEPDPYAPEALLRAKAIECTELRELLVAVAADLERLASAHPEHAERFLARAMRVRWRLWSAGS